MKRLVLLVLIMPFILLTSFCRRFQTNLDTTDLFLGFKYGMTATEYLSYLNAIQANKPITIMQVPPKCQGVSIPEFSYFGFDFTTRIEPLYCTPSFDEHCKLMSLSLEFTLEHSGQDLQELIQKEKDVFQSKYGPPNSSGGVYCWFFGHKRIIIEKNASIFYKYIPDASKKANYKSDL